MCIYIYVYIPKILKLNRAEDLPRQCVSPHPQNHEPRASESPTNMITGDDGDVLLPRNTDMINTTVLANAFMYDRTVDTDTDTVYEPNFCVGLLRRGSSC